MATLSTDISIVFSGGTNNTNANLSLGGDPSSVPITDNSINNLFDNVSPEETEDGHEDYRCIYYFNDGSDPVYLVQLFIVEDFEDGASIEIGIESHDELQRISISGNPTGGSMTLIYEGVSFISNYESDLGAWANSLESTLNALEDDDGQALLKEVSVSAAEAENIIFDISFDGRDGKRHHSLLTIDSNDLTPSSNITITAPQLGSPVNTIAGDINIDTVVPSGVVFLAASAESPITIPYLFPGDGFPLWIKRTVEAGTIAVASDGVKIRFVAESLDPTI